MLCFYPKVQFLSASVTSCMIVMVKCGGPDFLWMPQNKLKMNLLPNPLLMWLGMRGEGYRRINYSTVGWSWFVMIYLYFCAHDLTGGSHFLFYSKVVRQRSSAGRPQRRLVQFQFFSELLRRQNKRFLKCRRLRLYGESEFTHWIGSFHLMHKRRPLAVTIIVNK